MADCVPYPHLPQWNPPTGKPVLAVYDPVTGQLRPLNWGEPIPGMDCATAFCQSEIPSSKQMQDAYWSFHQRLTALEKKYCECICSGTPEPTPPPTTVIDSWQSPVVTLIYPRGV